MPRKLITLGAWDQDELERLLEGTQNSNYAGALLRKIRRYQKEATRDPTWVEDKAYIKQLEAQVAELEEERDELDRLTQVAMERPAKVESDARIMELEIEVRGLERFRDLRLRHNDEMERRTSECAQLRAAMVDCRQALKSVCPLDWEKALAGIRTVQVAELLDRVAELEDEDSERSLRLLRFDLRAVTESGDPDGCVDKSTLRNVLSQRTTVGQPDRVDRIELLETQLRNIFSVAKHGLGDAEGRFSSIRNLCRENDVVRGQWD